MCQSFVGLTREEYQLYIARLFADSGSTMDAVSDNNFPQLANTDNSDHSIEVKQSYPIIINPFGDQLEIVPAVFSLSPAWAKQPIGYDSYNANFADIKNNRTFKKPFKKSQFCLIAVSGFYTEASLVNEAKLTADSAEKAQAKPLLFQHHSSEVMLLAGVYEHNPEFSDCQLKDSQIKSSQHSFALLTDSRYVEDSLSQLSYKDTDSAELKDASDLTVDKLPIMVSEANADRFLVSNWKYIGRYF